MNIKRTLAITKKTFRTLLSDKVALALTIFSPILSVVVFGLAFSGDVSHVRVLVVNQDEGYQLPILRCVYRLAAPSLRTLTPK